jgi:hypothetical protein
MDWDNCLKPINSGATASAEKVASLQCVQVVYSNLGNALFVFAGVVAVFFIAWSGLQFLTSSGDPIRVGKARTSFTFALAGLIIVVLSYVIIQLVARVTGTDCKALGISC